MNEIRLQWRARSYSWVGGSQRFVVRPFVYTLLLSLLCTALFHAPFWTQLQLKIPGQLSLQIILWLVLFLLNSLIFTLLSLPGLPRLQRAMLTGLFLIAASSHYFISHFGTIIDRAMLQNVLETDLAEATALLNPDLVAKTIGWLLLLSWLNWKIAFKPQPWSFIARQWLLSMLFISSSLGMIAATQYAELASFFRNYRDVKYYALPLSTVSATVAVSKQQIAAAFPPHFQQLATDVHVVSVATTPRTLVLVLGETARADHFQLNGYPRPTNPRLSQLPVVSFSQVSACGTATAHSVPCMFSAMGREHYEESIAKNSSNILDILQTSGVAVRWFDNNSGCKGVCDRVPHQMLFSTPDCEQGCSDAVLLQALRQELSIPSQQDRIIVLHQLGSHGPEYYRRSQPSQKLFQPECTNKELNHCQSTDIINAYDNSLVATDALLAEVISQLSQQSNSALLYVSDHGESLGENGVYLHGLPYWMAPKAQTQVPMIWWMSPSFASSQQLDLVCLQQQKQRPLSHDHLFHSVPALFARASSAFKAELNFFASCTRG